jgi:23S rRNA pseudouridine2605 synthase
VVTEGIRLQKVLAAAGLGSRRACEELIAEARVEVNGRIVSELGTRVHPETDVIRVDGERVPTLPDLVVYAFNKPRGVLSTMTDDRGRPCVGDYVADKGTRVFHVGRLDADTEGLLLLTNDGDLAQRLAHPKHGVAKTYIATVMGAFTKTAERQLRTGIDLEDGPAVCDSIRVTHRAASRTQVELILHEGRNRIVRRMLDAVGFPVVDLVRTRIGPIALAGQKPGVLRELRPEQLRELYTAVGL